MGGRTYTDEELRAQVDTAVNSAVGTLRTELANLQASQEAAAIEERITTAVEAATAPLTAKVTELQSTLDAAVLETATERARAEALETAAAEATVAAEIASRRDARLALVKAAAPGFKEDYLTANTDRWAAMDEAEFAARLEEYAALSPLKAEGEGNGIPSTSALQATTGDVLASGRPEPKSPVSALAALRRQGVDVRTI